MVMIVLGKTRTKEYVFLIVFFFSLFGCNDNNNYDGDGSISYFKRDLPFWFIERVAKISFEQIDLNLEHKKRYKIDGISKSKSASISFEVLERIEANDEQAPPILYDEPDKKIIKATMGFKIFNSQNKILYEKEINLQNCDYYERFHQSKIDFICDTKNIEKEGVKLDKNMIMQQPLFIEFTYQPNETMLFPEDVNGRLIMYIE